MALKRSEVIQASSASVTRSPMLAAIGVATLSGLMLNRCEPTMTAIITVPAGMRLVIRSGHITHYRLLGEDHGNQYCIYISSGVAKSDSSDIAHHRHIPHMHGPLSMTNVVKEGSLNFVVTRVSPQNIRKSMSSPFRPGRAKRHRYMTSVANDDT